MDPAVPPAVTRPAIRRRADPIRLCLAHELGGDIDGAWWPRTDRIGNELPGLVAVLTPRLGPISAIDVSWAQLERPPDLNWSGWERKRQHVITVTGADACANLLIVPYATHRGLARMVLGLAASLPIDEADRGKRAFVTASAILHAAQQQRAPGS